MSRIVGLMGGDIDMGAVPPKTVAMTGTRMVKR